MVFSEGLTIDKLGPDSKVEVDMELKIDMGELDRLAGLDYTKYNKEQVDANYGNGNFNNCYSDLEQFGDFKLDTNKVTCTSHFKITLD